jgi:hypothetical protein
LKPAERRFLAIPERITDKKKSFDNLDIDDTHKI